MISIQQAFDLIGAHLTPLASETVSIYAALHRVLAVDTHSTVDLPPFNQSAVDGYALRQQDVTSIPCTLPLHGAVAAAPQEITPILQPNTVCRVLTGGMVPTGADSVIFQEITAAHADGIMITERFQPQRNIRRQAEEMSQGQLICPAGQRLTHGQLGALGMAGVANVTVTRQPKIVILVTGDEIAAPGAALKQGAVYDANGLLTANWCKAQGYANVQVHYVPDNFDAICQQLTAALSAADLVITTGGASVGDKDYIPQAAAHCGAQQVFWKVAQKPGKPLFFAIKNNVPIIGLPGNPGAVAVNLATHVQFALQCLEQPPLITSPPQLPFTMGITQAEITPDKKRDVWLRCQLQVSTTGKQQLIPQQGQASHMLGNLVHCNALAWLPAQTAILPAGSMLRYLPI